MSSRKVLVTPHSSGGGAGDVQVDITNRVRLSALPAALQECLEPLDRDDDGYVSVQEFHDAVKAYKAMRQVRMDSSSFTVQEAVSAMRVYDSMKSVERPAAVKAAKVPADLQRYLKEFDRDKDGTISALELSFAASMYSNAQHSNKRLKRIIWGMVIVFLMFSATVFALSVAAVHLMKETKVSEDGRLLSSSADGTAVKVASADFVTANATLRDQRSGRVMAVGQATALSSVSSTMTVKELNRLEFVSLQRWGSVLKLPVKTAFQRKVPSSLCDAGKELFLDTDVGVVRVCGAAKRLEYGKSLKEVLNGLEALSTPGILATLPVRERLTQLPLAIQQAEARDDAATLEEVEQLHALLNQTRMAWKNDTLPVSNDAEAARRLADTDAGFDYYYDGSQFCVEASGSRDYGSYELSGSGSVCLGASTSSAHTASTGVTLTYTYAKQYVAEISIGVSYSREVSGSSTSTNWVYAWMGWYFGYNSDVGSACDKCPCIDYDDGYCYYQSYEIGIPVWNWWGYSYHFVDVPCSSTKNSMWRSKWGTTLRPSCALGAYLEPSTSTTYYYRTNVDLVMSGFGGFGPSQESEDGALSAGMRFGVFPDYTHRLFEGSTYVGGDSDHDLMLDFKLQVEVQLGKRKYAYEYELGECRFPDMDYDGCSVNFNSPEDVIYDAMSSFIVQFASDILTDFSLYSDFMDAASAWQLERLDSMARVLDPTYFLMQRSLLDPDFSSRYRLVLQTASYLGYVPVLGDVMSSTIDSFTDSLESVGDAIEDFGEDVADEISSWF